MTTHETEYDRKLNKYQDKLKPYSTLHTIRVDGLPVRANLERCFDQIVILSKSELYTKLQNHLDKFMVKYHELPAEEQIRTVHSEYVKGVIKSLKSQAKYYESYKAHPKPAMLINDEKEGYTSVIDSDYFKDIKSEVQIDFPYQSIGEIMRDKTLPTSEKIVMCDKYLELKMSMGITKEAKKPTVIDTIAEFSLADIEALDISDVIDDDDDDDIEAPINIVDTKKSPKEMFDILCAKYPRKFSQNKKSGHVGYTKTYRGKTYTPTLITVNPYEEEAYKKKLMFDSTISYMTDSYYVKELKATMYFVRTTKEL